MHTITRSTTLLFIITIIIIKSNQRQTYVPICKINRIIKESILLKQRWLVQKSRRKLKLQKNRYHYEVTAKRIHKTIFLPHKYSKFYRRFDQNS